MDPVAQAFSSTPIITTTRTFLSLSFADDTDTRDEQMHSRLSHTTASRSTSARRNGSPAARSVCVSARACVWFVYCHDTHGSHRSTGPQVIGHRPKSPPVQKFVHHFVRQVTRYPGARLRHRRRPTHQARACTPVCLHPGRAMPIHPCPRSRRDSAFYDRMMTWKAGAQYKLRQVPQTDELTGCTFKPQVCAEPHP